MLQRAHHETKQEQCYLLTHSTALGYYVRECLFLVYRQSATRWNNDRSFIRCKQYSATSICPTVTAVLQPRTEQFALRWQMRMWPLLPRRSIQI